MAREEEEKEKLRQQEKEFVEQQEIERQKEVERQKREENERREQLAINSLPVVIPSAPSAPSPPVGAEDAGMHSGLSPPSASYPKLNDQPSNIKTTPTIDRSTKPSWLG